MYVFSDTRIRDYLTDQISTLRARKYHSAIGRSIEEVHAKDIDIYLDALAYQFGRSGELEKSLEYSVKAGDRAASIFANLEAVNHFKHALEVLQSVDNQPLKGEVLERLGTVTFLYGRTEEAIALTSEALELVEKTGDKTKTAELCDRIGLMHYLSGYEAQKAQDYFNRGIALLEDNPQKSTELAHLYKDLSRFYWKTGQFAPAAEMSQKALDVAHDLGDDEVEADAYLTFAIVLPPDQADKLLEYEYKALEIALKGNIVDAALRAYNNITLQHIINGDVSKASEVLNDALKYAQKVGHIPRLVTFNQILAYTYLLLGELEKAKKTYDDLATTLPKHYAVIDETALTDLGVIYLRLGDLQKSRESLERLQTSLQSSKDFQGVSYGYLAFANLEAASGDFASAESYLKKDYELLKKIGLNVFSSGLTPELFANLVEVELNLEKVVEAEQFLSEFKQTSEKLHENITLAYLNKAEGLLAAKSGDWKKGVELLDKSADLWRGIGWPYELAETLFRLASALDGLGDRARESEVLGEALQLYTKMGAKLGASNVEQKLKKLKEAS